MVGLEEALKLVASGAQAASALATSRKSWRSAPDNQSGSESEKNAFVADVATVGGPKTEQLSAKALKNGEEERADVAILVALREPEQSQVISVFGPQWDQTESREGIVYRRASLEVQDESVSIVVAAQNDMGMVTTAIMTTKIIQSWKPKLLVMPGICAGVKGKVDLGDLVVAKQIFDYGSGKLADGQLSPDYQPIAIDDFICQCANDLASDSSALTSIRQAWPSVAGTPRTDLRAHVEAMASGAAVVADSSIIKGVREHKRSLAAIDMEAYGLVKAAAFGMPKPLTLVVKAVQDFANDEKTDEYREYAAYVSASFLRVFIERYWVQLQDFKTGYSS